MKCPNCNSLENKVVDSRMSREGDIIRRRRECLSCSGRFTTYERVEEEFPMVIKKDNRRESFDRIKIFHGIKKAAEKRKISVEQIEELVDRVVAGVRDYDNKEIPSSEIGKKVMEVLKDIDEVAYVRFASVYRSFRDVNEFMDELKEILGSKDKIENKN